MSRYEELMRRADDARVEFIALTDEESWEAAYRHGVGELLPVTEAVAEADREHLDGVAVVQGDLGAICHYLERPIGELYHRQVAFHTAMTLEREDLPIFEGLSTAPVAAAERAHRLMIAPFPDYDSLPEPERELFVPAARTLPVSVELMEGRESYQWAAYMQAAATWLRAVEGRYDKDLVRAETEAMVGMARIGYKVSHYEAVWAELRQSITVWLEQLEHGLIDWSAGQRRTLESAAELLELMDVPTGAEALRRAVAQVAGAEAQDSPDRLLAALDLGEHYRAALAALPPER
ncbi:hypothetical protein [Glycomyces xiaoerkulensis]|uniref:hypothetical protein n=1 Tax=Glycomyces xiaoerkulensis TaxID=2038139 RepID=UPI000C267D11|nr:hypothetical protein [Glycomyces xiaoerkulensis]